MSKQLAKPDAPYPDWSRFLAAVWRQGMSHMDPESARRRAFRGGESVASSFTRRNESSYIRPSSFVACARQTWFMQEGVQPEPMPDNIGLTFAVGHMLHEMSYGAVESALPECFRAEFEVKVSLPEWWPRTENTAKDGHVDCLLDVVDEGAASAYLDTLGAKRVLVDFKTMGGFSARKHVKVNYADTCDSFGYLTQLAIYQDATEAEVCLLAGINRDQLTAELMPRRIDNATLARERMRLQLALTQTADPGKELLDRWEKEAHFYCGLSGRKGYCPFADHCHATHGPVGE